MGGAVVVSVHISLIIGSEMNWAFYYRCYVHSISKLYYSGHIACVLVVLCKVVCIYLQARAAYTVCIAIIPVIFLLLYQLSSFVFIVLLYFLR